MDYCEDCNGILVPKKSKGKIVLVCRRCGKVYSKKKSENLLVVDKNPDVEKAKISSEEDEGVLPVTEKICDKCGNNRVYWWLIQTRSSDEPETRFFKCTKCGYTWREYD